VWHPLWAKGFWHAVEFQAGQDHSHPVAVTDSVPEVPSSKASCKLHKFSTSSQGSTTHLAIVDADHTVVDVCNLAKGLVAEVKMVLQLWQDSEQGSA